MAFTDNNDNNFTNNFTENNFTTNNFPKNNKSGFFKGIIFGVIVTLIIGVVANGAYQFYRSKNPAPVGQSAETPSKVTDIMNILDTYYVDGIDKNALTESMYAGLVAGIGDPYTVYFTAEQCKAFMEDTSGTYAGIGVVVSIDPDDNKIVVVAPFEGSPGEQAGIVSGDKIVKVNGTDVSGSELDTAISMMKGTPGTPVTVTIQREGVDNFDVAITRANITVPTVSSKMLDDSIGYIRISQFDSVTEDQFKSAFNDLTSQGEKGLIIDLRNNPGGLFNIVCDIADMLVPPNDTIVYTIDKNGKKAVTTSKNGKFHLPLTILVNGGSASASEILSGAVKDLGVGTLVGTKTFGKGLVQSMVQLSDGSAVKVTIQRYYTPSGVCIQGTGIQPDYVVELPDDLKDKVSLTPEEDIQLQKAEEVIKSQISGATALQK